MLNFIITAYLAFTVSNIFLLSVQSVVFVSIPTVLLQIIRVIFFIISFLVLKKISSHPKVSNFPFIYILILIYMGMVAVRFPLFYPSHDDLALHLTAGDYGLNIWKNQHFMPMGLATYFYPAAEMNYTPFLYTIGIRMTILINYLVLSLWMVSLYIRFNEILKSSSSRLLLKMLFLVFPFIPPLMSTHGSLMTDYFSLILIAESFYQLVAKNKDKTFAVFIFIIAALVKQSTVIFTFPVFFYYIFQYRQKIQWKIIFGFIFIVSFYFIRLYFETGNPLFGLLNTFFRSPLYELNNFKDVRWGPNNIIEVIVWPVIGQFAKRFDETVVPAYTTLLFSPFFIVAYIAPLILSFIRKKSHYLIYFASFVLWGLISGYSRYVIPLVFISLLTIIQEVHFWKKTVFIFIAFIIAVSSFKSDLAFRPYPSIKTSKNNQIYIRQYQEGLHYLFKDAIPSIAQQIKKDFYGYGAVIPVYRGISTFYAYLGSVNGLPVIQGISKDQFRNIIQNKVISSDLKKNLLTILMNKKILVATERGNENQISTLYISDFYRCRELRPASNVSYLQGGYFDAKLILFSCEKKG